MKSKLLAALKVMAYAVSYALILAASVYVTMNLLIKGAEIQAPDFREKGFDQAVVMAQSSGLKFKKIVGNYDRNYKPLTVIDQFPSPGVRIKKGSYVKLFVTSELVEVIMPDLEGHNLREAEEIIQKSGLKKRFVSYVDSAHAPVDFVISQSVPPGSQVPQAGAVDLLISKGTRNQSFIMPDLIGRQGQSVLAFFETRGLKISNITEVEYPGLAPGIVIKQFPSSGYKISRRNLIGIQVSR